MDYVFNSVVINLAHIPIWVNVYKVRSGNVYGVHHFTRKEAEFAAGLDEDLVYRLKVTAK